MMEAIKSKIALAYMEYSAAENLSRNAFMSLQSEPYVDSSLISPQQRRMKWLRRQFRKQQSHVYDGTQRTGRKIISSPRKAIQHINHHILSLGPVKKLRHNSRCEGRLFKQRIRIEGCISKVLVNRFCQGTCMSYYIPRLRPHKLKLKAMFQSCSICQPSEFDTVQVKMDCPGNNEKELVRHVIRVKKCSCMSIDLED